MDDTVRLVAWLVFVGAMIALQYAGRASEGKPDADVLYRYSTAVGGIVQDAVILLIVVALAGFSASRLGLRRPRSIAGALKALGMAVLAVYAIEVVYSLFVHIGNEQGLTPERWEPGRATEYVVNAIVICTFIPFVEELTYRGLGYTLLERFGRWPAIIAVGLLFGLAHGLIVSLPILAGFGCVLAWVRARTESVVPGMFLHALFNLVALVAAVAL